MIVNRKRDSRRRCLVTAAAVLAAILPAAAHEFWVTPSAWIVEPGRRATLLVNVGDQFPNASSFTTPDRIDVVRLVGPDRTHAFRLRIAGRRIRSLPPCSCRTPMARTSAS